MVGERTRSVGGRMRRASVILRRAAASFAFAAASVPASRRARASSTDDPMFFNFLADLPQSVGGRQSRRGARHEAVGHGDRFSIDIK